jgi:hypothetical protein
MNVVTLAGLNRAALAEHPAFAVWRSRFYRDLHRGLENAQLTALPMLTKAILMCVDSIPTNGTRQGAVVRRSERAITVAQPH